MTSTQVLQKEFHEISKHAEGKYVLAKDEIKAAKKIVHGSWEHRVYGN